MAKTMNPPDPGLLSLNVVTVRDQWNLRECIEGCARHHIPGIAPWRDKLAELGVKTAAKMIRDNGLTVTGLCRGGSFPANDRAGRARSIEDNYRAIDDAAALEAQCLILVVGGLPPESKDLAGARAMVRDGIGQILDHARSAGVRLAIEPLHPMTCADRACVNTLAQALDICDALGSGPGDRHLGVAVDVYHVWWDPQLKQQIDRARKRVLAFHVCDWLVPTADLLLDRGMMGDGVIDIPAIRAMVEGVGYDGFCEVEIMSAANWWRRPADEVLRICVERHATAV